MRRRASRPAVRCHRSGSALAGVENEGAIWYNHNRLLQAWEGKHNVTDMEVGYGEVPSHELPAEMLTFVQTKVDSFVKWDLLRFLKENPHSADTPSGLARCVGRQPEVVGPELEKMADDGLVQRRDVGGLAVYSLTQEPATRDLIWRFLEKCEDRRFRLRVVFHVARNVR